MAKVLNKSDNTSPIIQSDLITAVIGSISRYAEEVHRQDRLWRQNDMALPPPQCDEPSVIVAIEVVTTKAGGTGITLVRIPCRLVSYVCNSEMAMGTLCAALMLQPFMGMAVETSVFSKLVTDDVPNPLDNKYGREDILPILWCSRGRPATMFQTVKPAIFVPALMPMVYITSTGGVGLGLTFSDTTDPPSFMVNTIKRSHSAVTKCIVLAIGLERGKAETFYKHNVHRLDVIDQLRRSTYAGDMVQQERCNKILNVLHCTCEFSGCRDQSLVDHLPDMDICGMAKCIQPGETIGQHLCKCPAYNKCDPAHDTTLCSQEVVDRIVAEFDLCPYVFSDMNKDKTAGIRIGLSSLGTSAYLSFEQTDEIKTKESQVPAETFEDSTWDWIDDNPEPSHPRKIRTKRKPHKYRERKYPILASSNPVAAKVPVKPVKQVCKPPMADMAEARSGNPKVVEVFKPVVADRAEARSGNHKVIKVCKPVVADRAEARSGNPKVVEVFKPVVADRAEARSGNPKVIKVFKPSVTATVFKPVVVDRAEARSGNPKVIKVFKPSVTATVFKPVVADRAEARSGNPKVIKVFKPSVTATVFKPVVADRAEARSGNPKVIKVFKPSVTATVFKPVVADRAEARSGNPKVVEVFKPSVANVAANVCKPVIKVFGHRTLIPRPKIRCKPVPPDKTLAACRGILWEYGICKFWSTRCNHCHQIYNRRFASTFTSSSYTSNTSHLIPIVSN